MTMTQRQQSQSETFRHRFCSGVGFTDIVLNALYLDSHQTASVVHKYQFAEHNYVNITNVQMLCNVQ